MTTPTETAPVQERPYKSLIAWLKDLIKDEAAYISELKQSLRAETTQDGRSGYQSTIALNKRTHRAKLLIYGFIRGRTWDRIEQGHRDALPPAYLKASVAYQWNDLAGRELPVPEALAPWLLK